MSEHFVLESITTILVVLIPSLIGVIATKKITNSWQIKKEEFQLKKEKYELKIKSREKIQGAYKKSWFDLINLYFEFKSRVEEYYIDSWQLESEKEKNVTFTYTIPDDKEKLPKVVFASDLKKFIADRELIRKEVWNFWSTLTVYFESEKLTKHFKEQTKNEKFVKEMFRVFIDSNDGKDFKTNREILSNTLSELRDKISIGGNLLATTPLRDLPEYN